MKKSHFRRCIMLSLCEDSPFHLESTASKVWAEASQCVSNFYLFCWEPWWPARRSWRRVQGEEMQNIRNFWFCTECGFICPCVQISLPRCANQGQVYHPGQAACFPPLDRGPCNKVFTSSLLPSIALFSFSSTTAPSHFLGWDDRPFQCHRVGSLHHRCLPEAKRGGFRQQKL